MRKLIVNEEVLREEEDELINVVDVDDDKFFVFQLNRGGKGILVQLGEGCGIYHAMPLNDNFSKGHRYLIGYTKEEATLISWRDTFDDADFYQLDTLEEVFEFAFE